MRATILALCLVATTLLGCAVETVGDPLSTLEPTFQAPDATPEIIAIRYLLVSFDGAEDAPEGVTRSRDDARARAIMLAGLAGQGGTDFRAMVRQYSDANDVLRRVTRGLGSVPPVVERAARQLSVNGTSRAVETPYGYVIVRREADPMVGPRIIGVRHFLIAYAGARNADDDIERTREEAEALANELRSRVVDGGEDFETIAEEHSDGPSAEWGGDLGPVERGTMVPGFERAAFALEVDGISEVVETPFGFHVINRYE